MPLTTGQNCGQEGIVKKENLYKKPWEDLEPWPGGKCKGEKLFQFLQETFERTSVDEQERIGTRLGG